MQRPVSSSDSSVDDSGVQDFKAAEAAQFRKLTGSPTKFKEAQADALRADSIRQTPTKKPRSNSLGQTTPAPRTRSTPQTQTPTSAAQLLKLLGSDSKDTRQLLHSALAQLDASSRRLAHSDAERRALESAQLAQTTQTLQAASAVQRNAVAAQAEVSLYRLQMESAQQEILRAQEVVRSLEMQRDDAERAATKARTMARRLHADKMALLAKEQGRKEGYETGFGHGHVIAVEKERRRNEQRRLEAEIQRRQLAPAPPSEPRGAFIEEHIPSGDLSRNVSNAQPPAPTELERRQRRVSSDSASIIRPLPPADPSVAAEPPVDNSSPRSQRPPSTTTSSSRRVSAPPAVPQQQQQQPPARVRTNSIDGSRTSRASVANVVPNDTLNRSNSASTQRPRRSDPVPNDNSLNRSNSTSTQRPHQNSAASRQSMPTPAPAAPHIPVPIHNVQDRPQRRPSVRSASTSTFDSDPVGAATGVSTGAGVRQTRRPSLVEAMMPRVIPMPPPPMHLPVPTSVSASTSTSGFGFGSTQTRVQMPEPITMPAHVPMPRPPPGAIPAQAFPPSPAGQTFEVERPRQQQQQPRSPSSVSTSLRTLRLTSFPVTGPAGPGSDRAGSERGEFGPGAPGSSAWGPGGAGMGMGGVGAGGGVGRERELSVILEQATEGSPGGSQLGNENGNGGRWYAPAPPRQQTPWTRGSSPYSDPRGMEEWRRGTDEEAPRNQLPPPSPVTSPGMLSPYPPIQPPQNNVHGQPSQDSLQSSTLHRSSSGSTVNITIVPPSRPQSIALSGPPDGPASARHLSPNHAHDTPVVPEEEEDDDDDDYDEDDDDDGPPPGFVPANLNPLPVFAQGVQSQPPPGFVVQGVMPLPVGSQQMGGRLQHQQQQPPPQNRSAPAAWTAPPLIGAHSMEPVRPPSHQMGGVLGNPNAGADANANSTWAAPPLMGANVMGPAPPRPLSRQGGGLATPGAWGAAPPLTVEHPPRPLSRQQQGGPVNPAGAGAWGAAPPLTVERPRPLSRQGNPTATGGWGAPPALTTEPVRPLSRQGDPSGGWGAPPARLEPMPQGGSAAPGAWGVAPPLMTEPSRPPSRQMGGMLGNPAATTWAAPPAVGANAMGPPQQPGQLGAAPPPGGWPFPGPYPFGQNSTPSSQPPPLGFPAPSASNAPHSPQPMRPQSFTGDAAISATTPRPIYGPPVNPAFGTGYPSQTPGIAAGYPLPASVSNSSPATTNTTSRVNAGTTPGFAPRALSRPVSRASSGFTRYNNNQTPNPNANLGITNPYTSIVEEGEGGGSGSSGSSTSSLGLPRMTSIDRMTANNTAVNASVGYVAGPAIYAAGPVIPVIPPSPANSHRPLRR